MKREIQQFEHDGLNHPDEHKRAAIREFDTHAPLSAPAADPLLAQMIALFMKCDERGKNLLLQIGKINALYPRG